MVLRFFKGQFNPMACSLSLEVTGKLFCLIILVLQGPISGSPFQRISRQTIEPSKFLLRVWSASNDYTLPHNGTTFVYFQLCNHGDSERFQVTVKDRLGYLVTRRMLVVELRAETAAAFSLSAPGQRALKTSAKSIVFLLWSMEQRQAPLPLQLFNCLLPCYSELTAHN